VDDYLQPFGSPDQNEDEVLLRGGTRFMIDAIIRHANGITEVVMHEVESFVDRLAAAGLRVASGSNLAQPTTAAVVDGAPSAVAVAVGGGRDGASAESTVPAVYHFASTGTTENSTSTDGAYIDGMSVGLVAAAAPGSTPVTSTQPLNGIGGNTSTSSSYITGLELATNMLVSNQGNGNVGEVGLEAPIENESDETRL
jgi:hypothetical protein